MFNEMRNKCDHFLGFSLKRMLKSVSEKCETDIEIRFIYYFSQFWFC